MAAPTLVCVLKSIAQLQKLSDDVPHNKELVAANTTAQVAYATLLLAMLTEKQNKTEFTEEEVYEMQRGATGYIKFIKLVRERTKLGLAETKHKCDTELERRGYRKNGVWQVW